MLNESNFHLLRSALICYFQLRSDLQFFYNPCVYEYVDDKSLLLIMSQKDEKQSPVSAGLSETHRSFFSFQVIEFLMIEMLWPSYGWSYYPEASVSISVIETRITKLTKKWVTGFIELLTNKIEIGVKVKLHDTFTLPVSK